MNKETLKNKIIVGIQGIGKTRLARSNGGYVDLDLVSYNGNMKIYLNVISYYQENGFIPLVPYDKKLMEVLKEKGLEYVIPVPKFVFMTIPEDECPNVVEIESNLFDELN